MGAQNSRMTVPPDGVVMDQKNESSITTAVSHGPSNLCQAAVRPT